MLDARKCFPPRCLPSWHVAMFDPTTTNMFILRQILACTWCKNGYVVRGRMVSLVNLKMLGRNYVYLANFQPTNRYITDKWIPAILEVGRKTSCFQPRCHKKKLTPTSAGCFFHQIPMKFPNSTAGDLRLLPSGRFAYILDGWPFLICCQEKNPCSNRLRKSQMDSTKMSQTNPTCISPEKMMTLVSYVATFSSDGQDTYFS